MVMEDLPEDLLDLCRPWNRDEFKDADFVDLEVKEARIKFKRQNLLRAKCTSPQENHNTGLFEDMEIIQKHYLDKEYKKPMLSAQSDPKILSKTRGTGYDTAWATEPNHKFHILKIAQKHDSNKP